MFITFFWNVPSNAATITVLPRSAISSQNSTMSLNWNDLIKHHFTDNTGLQQVKYVLLFNILNIKWVKHVSKNNKWPMGHIAHLRNQFKSMVTFEQSYNYIFYKTGPVVEEEKIFKFWEYIFAILLSPIVKRCGLSIWTNLYPLPPGMLFAKFGWNWPCGSIKEDL